MYIAATTSCFSDMPLDQALEKIADLEYTHVELMFHESGNYLKPSEVSRDLRGTLNRLSNLYRLVPVAFSLEIDTEETEEYVRQFDALSRLAKAMQVVTVTVRSAPWGFPFNSEVERLRKCVELASKRGILLGLLTERGRLTEDIETAKALCKVVPGLHLALDPSHYVYKTSEHHQNYESVLNLVSHVRLRDTSPEKFQVCVGQGSLEYGRLISQLEQCGYRRGLSVDIIPQDDIDVSQEMRKMRLLLESLL
ncbi:MAG: sugar phosphate isomerase/epimerase [Planctomycetia bacterium]|nr:sugar phosphate isomerase/epimerase [Planctomycetia bacterium]